MNTSTKAILPPISTFDSEIPVISIDLSEAEKGINLSHKNQPSDHCNEYDDLEDQKFASNSSPSTPKREHVRPSQFTIEEDLEIVKCVFAFYKPTWNQKIPWSFWQIYRKTTGSQRSNSSLYHHWEGSICKKYGMFINSGRLDDCIKFIQAQIAMDAKHGFRNSNNNSLSLSSSPSNSSQQSGTPLVFRRAQTHNVFQDSPQLQTNIEGQQYQRPSPLLRYFSMPCFEVSPPYFSTQYHH